MEVLMCRLPVRVGTLCPRRTSPQILGGKSGGIVVEGSDRFYPMLRNLKERVMLLKHIPHPTLAKQAVVALNGLVAPTIAMRPGQVVPRHRIGVVADI